MLGPPTSYSREIHFACNTNYFPITVGKGEWIRKAGIPWLLGKIPVSTCIRYTLAVIAITNTHTNYGLKDRRRALRSLHKF